MRSWPAVLGFLIVVAVSLTAALAAGSAARSRAPVAAGVPVVVELFTSQGCSSCPPADALLVRLAREPNVVAITRPVTLWDNLGWKDTLARRENTDLQRAYAANGGVGSGVYTPQAVIQGGGVAVGSNEGAIRSLITAAGARAGPVVAIVPTRDGGRSITLSGYPGRPATLSVLALKSSAMVSIGRGENGGSKIRYTNVVLDEQVIGTWAGHSRSFTVAAQALHKAGADRAALLVRQGAAGPILAARFL